MYSRSLPSSEISYFGSPDESLSLTSNLGFEPSHHFQILTRIRKEFRKSNRIFVSPEGWYLTKECIWCEKASIEGKLNISSQYKDLREFFVDSLGVQVPDLGMLVEELKKVATSTRSVETAKSLI
jgi:hypothetical protein